MLFRSTMAGIEDWPFSERVARFQEVFEIVDQLLRNEVTTYNGQYYRLQETAMQPRPIQEPRPPITVAAHGPKMLRIAARLADSWSSMGGFGLSPEALYEITVRRNRDLDDYCREAGRDPATLRRSLLLWPPIREMVYESTAVFEEIIQPYADAGINEFILTYPSNEEQIPVFERIATHVIPTMKA